MRRRSAVTALGGCLASLAGCLNVPADVERTEDLPEVLDHEAVQYRREDDLADFESAEDSGRVHLYATEAAAESAIDPDAALDPEAVRGLLGDVEFDRDRLLHLVTHGADPDDGPPHIRVGNFGVRSGVSTREDQGIDRSAPTLVAGASFRPLEYPERTEAVVDCSALVRVRFDGSPPDQTVVTLQNGWGNQTDLGTRADE